MRKIVLLLLVGFLVVINPLGFYPGSREVGAAEEQESAPPQPGEEQAEEAIKLQPNIVTAPRVAKPLLEVPAAVGAVEKEDIQLGRQQLGLDESLVKIPGLFFQNRFNFAQDLRIAIRGFGARAAFGIRGVKILVDGIPETLPDGQAQVDNIDLGSAERIEVIRGPTSSLYGNASGGVISIITEEGPEEPFVETRLSWGEFRFQKYQLKTGGQHGPLNYLVNLSRLDMEGFREHSGTENVLVNSKLRLDIDETSTVTALINFAHAPIADDPGALTREQAEADPRQARDRNVQFDAGEDITQGRFGLVYQKRFGQSHELSANAYYVFRDFANKLPFQGGGSVDFDRFVVGGGMKYIYTTQIWGRRNRLTLGIDLELQNDDRRRFDNNNGQLGDLVFNQEEEVSSIGPFIQDEFRLLKNLELTVGVRYDRVRFSVEDFFLSDGDDSGARTLDKFSPMIGLLYTFSPALHIYGNVSTSFETPTTTEFANPSGRGGFNPDLEPQKATNYEIGVKGNWRGRWSYELALFTVRVEDELIPFELPDNPGRTFFRNAGKSTRNGVELGLKAELWKGLTASVAYTFSDFFFEEFRTEDGVFDDNEIPGIPKHQLHGEIAYFHPSGLYGIWDILFVDKFFADNANTVQNDAYTIANLRLGYVGQFGNWEVSPFLGLNNLFDDQYNANVRLNAFGGRFFEPGPDFNVYGGLSLSHTWSGGL
ncbi:MAG: TonB-dependent receptor [Nitrospinota bacterium]|nr:MAG: TonB-dependent receptor [Nitrospinota bacterium]